MTSTLPKVDWPRPAAPPLDPVIEERVAGLVSRMTLEEKVGQMVQPELAELTVDDVREYKIGSALNGAGIWPGGRRHATEQDWVDTVDAFWQAARDAYAGRGFHVPFAWATDAVHGHNNVHGATIYPHNIGLGAAGDPELIRRIGAATAAEISATGMDWTFAPTVTTPRDRRWGRYYEGYSADGDIVEAYAAEMVRGLQEGPHGVIATMKHWIADGATADGQDRGTAYCSEEILRDVHARGFVAGIAAGAQAVMASFSSWSNPANYDHRPDEGEPYNAKVHGSRFLLTDVLKGRLGFTGIVISDWDAHAEIAGASIGDAGYAITAGMDVLMVAGRAAWQSVHRTAVADVRAGRIPMGRIDDAVTRVLRVKMRAGLWDKPRPAARRAPDAAAVLGRPAHRALSREAARASQVLLKNANATLPIARDARVLVTGSGAASIQKQTGGWTLTWQGDDVTAADLPGSCTIGEAVTEIVGAERATVSPTLDGVDPAAHDVVVVVIGEDSYAEMRGTIKPWRGIGYAQLKRSYAADLALLRTLRGAGATIVTVLLTGRALYVTEEINLSDSFVVGWLPGPDGRAVTDVLFAAQDFTGRLPAVWPARASSAAVNRIPPGLDGYIVPEQEQAPDGEHAPLFDHGYGLTLTARDAGPGVLPLDPGEAPAPVAPVPDVLPVPGVGFRMLIGGHNSWSRPPIAPTGRTEQLVVTADWVADALSLEFHGYPAFVYAQGETLQDLRGYAEGGHLQFDVTVHAEPAAPLLLACHDDHPAQPGIDLRPLLPAAGAGKRTLRIPGNQIAAAGIDLQHVDVPFMLYTEGRGHIEVARVEWRTG